VPGESFFMAMGGLGVTLAGFAGLISALDRRPVSQSPISAYRITGIVFLGFSLAFAGLATVVAFTVSGEDLGVAVRTGTAILLAAHVRGFLQARPGPAWPDERERWVTIAGLSVLTAVTVGNLVVASVGYLELLMLLGWIGPVGIFYNTVSDAFRNDSPAPPTDEIADPAPSTPA
jgi:hypothetical protein